MHVNRARMLPVPMRTVHENRAREAEVTAMLAAAKREEMRTLAISAVVVLPLVLKLVGSATTSESLLSFLRWPILLSTLTVSLGFIYRYGPSRRDPKWRWVTWGSATAAVLWLAASMLFSWYVANFDSYNKTYGSLGAGVGFMVWIWLSVVIVLLGAELNAEMEHQTAKDSTEGAPKPLGARGANMADHVGASHA